MGALWTPEIVDDLRKAVDGVLEPVVEPVDEHERAAVRALADRGVEPGLCLLQADLVRLQGCEISRRV